MKPPVVKPSGEIIISFSESMNQIDKVFEKNLDSTIEISIYSVEFQKKVFGKWTPKPKDKRNLNLKEKIGNETDEESFDSFDWYVSGEQDDGLTFQAVFERPELLSRGDDFDKFDLQIKDKSIFKSKSSGE